MSAIDQISEPTFLELGDERNRRRLAFRRRFPTDAGKNRPGLVWLGGFKSDMLSTKVTMLDQWAAEQGRALLQIGQSNGGLFNFRMSIRRRIEKAFSSRLTHVFPVKQNSDLTRFLSESKKLTPGAQRALASTRPLSQHRNLVDTQ